MVEVEVLGMMVLVVVFLLLVVVAVLLMLLLVVEVVDRCSVLEVTRSTPDFLLLLRSLPSATLGSILTDLFLPAHVKRLLWEEACPDVRDGCIFARVNVSSQLVQVICK